MPIETDTRILLLDAAERLFAEAGFAATSLRNITAAAGVNLASVNYHFGSKDALLEAVIQRRLAPVNDERLRRLEELEGQAGTEPLNLEKALRCFLEPPFEKMREWGESGRLFMRVVGRIHSDTNPKMAAMFLKQLEETLNDSRPPCSGHCPNSLPKKPVVDCTLLSAAWLTPWRGARRSPCSAARITPKRFRPSSSKTWFNSPLLGWRLLFQS